MRGPNLAYTKLFKTFYFWMKNEMPLDTYVCISLKNKNFVNLHTLKLKNHITQKLFQFHVLILKEV